MKYTVEGFLQEKLVTLDLDLSDALILRWFIDFAGTGCMRSLIYNHAVYYFVKYSGVIADLPVLGIGSTKGVGKRFDRYVEKGLLLKETRRKGFGTLLFFAPTRKLLELQYNSQCNPLKGTGIPLSTPKGTAVTFRPENPEPAGNYIQNELDFDESVSGQNMDGGAGKDSGIGQYPGESDKENSQNPDRNSMKGTTVPFEDMKGTPVAIRKEPQFPSERNSSSLALNNSSTKNSSTTDSLTTEPENDCCSLDSAAAVKAAFSKKISTEVFSADFWEKTAAFLTEHDLPAESIPRYVNFLFDYAKKNSPRNLTHYLYKTAATAYMLAEFQAQETNHAASAEIQDEKRHRCALCAEIFRGPQCPNCGLKVKDFQNESALREAKIRYCRRE